MGKILAYFTKWAISQIGRNIYIYNIDYLIHGDEQYNTHAMDLVNIVFLYFMSVRNSSYCIQSHWTLFSQKRCQLGQYSQKVQVKSFPLSQLYLYTKGSPKTWLRTFLNMPPRTEPLTLKHKEVILKNDSNVTNKITKFKRSTAVFGE